MKKINFWYLSSFLISFVVIIPIITVGVSFFEETSNYYKILKNTFLIEYILNSLTLLVLVLIFTFVIGTGTAYLVSFFKFPFSDFFKWALILSFAVPPYIYAYSLTAFFDNYGIAYTILTNIFGEGEYNKIIPKVNSFVERTQELADIDEFCGKLSAVKNTQKNKHIKTKKKQQIKTNTSKKLSKQMLFLML